VEVLDSVHTRTMVYLSNTGVHGKKGLSSMARERRVGGRNTKDVAEVGNRRRELASRWSY
jgi:hypothetical protein